MGSTNKTTNYELSQYIGTDKPSWLNDYNNDMLKIDTQMKANATAAGNAQSTATAADGKADANAESISTLNTQINTPSTGLAATVSTHTTDISNINSKIGDTPLSTAAQTLTGAIEEVKGSIPSITTCLKFIGVKRFTAAADSVKTLSALLDDIHAQLIAYLATKNNSYRFQTVAFSPNSTSLDSHFTRDQASLLNKNFASSIPADLIVSTSGDSSILTAAIMSTGSYVRKISLADGTVTNNSSTVPTSGYAWLDIQEYEIA